MFEKSNVNFVAQKAEPDRKSYRIFEICNEIRHRFNTSFNLPSRIDIAYSKSQI